MAGSHSERLRRRRVVTTAMEPAPNNNARARATRVGREQEETSNNNDGHDLRGVRRRPPPSSSHQGEFSSSHGRHDTPTLSAALRMVQELLRYRPTEAGHEAWLAHIAELVQAAGPAPSHARPPPPPSHAIMPTGGPTPSAPSPSPLPGARTMGAPPPLPGARATGAPPQASHGASSPDCLILQREPEDACVTLKRQRERQNRAVQNLAAVGRNNRAPVNIIVAYGGGCQTFTEELRRMAWLTKFHPELPPRFDGTANPIEFLQLYTMSIQTAGGDDKVMVNWFHISLKEAARS